MKLSIVVPCYNEEKNIPLILERFESCIKRDDIEVILVNNGSSDGSQQVLDQLINNYSFARTVHVEQNQGYGYGILFGLSQTRGEYIGWTHADMQTDPADLLKALNIIETNDNSQNLYIKGLRKNRPLFDVFFTFGMSIFETIFMKKNLFDINAQPNVFHRSFYKSWNNPPHDFSLDLYALYIAKKNGLNVIRFDVIFPNRIHGQSSWNTGLASKWKFIKRTLQYSIKLKEELNNGVHRS
ncbi:glycosyltransferase [Paenibacillus sp. LMG 31460]|uniref:Glycosyltransferase n=1 Tax=Paenibacillus germinis TaxID=2654979 RepID=A0ABX1Z6K7_9BACL|nr:glycosyltransferase [Paenibacillus germinis]